MRYGSSSAVTGDKAYFNSYGIYEEIDSLKSMLRKISEKIDDTSHKADESAKTIIEILSQKVDELQLVAAKNVISKSGRESNTAENSPEETSCTMEGVDSSAQYEAEFKSGHLGIIKGNYKHYISA